jgi:hypothetical protein
MNIKKKKKKKKKKGNKNQECTFPTNSIGIKKEGTAETNPRSRYSNSVNLCQLPKRYLLHKVFRDYLREMAFF